MKQNNWDQSQLFVLKSLERIEAKLDSLDGSMRSHVQQDDSRHEQLAVDLAKVDKDMKWHSRVASGIGSVGAILISVFYGSHR